MLVFGGMMLLMACASDNGSSPPPPDGSVAGVTVSVDAASLAVGGTLQLNAVVRSSSGAVIQGATITWSTTSPATATVTASGLVTALAVGTTEIRATAQGQVGSARIDVYQTATANGTINVDPSQRFQVMRGWQSGTNWGIEHPLHATVRDRVLDLAVNELGLDRVRMPLRSGAESSRDWYGDHEAGTVTDAEYRCNRYATVNDNADPMSLNPAGFNFTEVDLHMVNTVLPMRQRLRAAGEDLYFMITYIAHTIQNCAGTQFHHTQAEEYGEFLLAAFLHLRDTYGVVPDAVELVNEPDVGWSFGSQPMAGMLEAAGRRLKSAGFNPTFMGPSTTSASNAIAYYTAMVGRPGNEALVSELSYHRYDGGLSSLPSIGSLAASRGIAAVMGEKNRASVKELYEDLTVANASAWEQGTMGWYKHPTWSDDGTAHYWTDYSTPGAPTVWLGTLSRPLRQYFRYIRRGAVRIGSASQDAAYRPVAFINTSGQYVAVIWTSKAGSFTISGLRAGTYGINYTTAAQLNVEAGQVIVQAGTLLPVSIPQAGVVTVYQK